MTKQDQKHFIKNLCDSIKLELVSKIEAGKIPEKWDGLELRELLKEKFERESYLTDKRSARYKDYTNEVLINCL